ncbi:3-dehydroquinate synthase [Alicyclobacillus sp. ALC3]|uniref:3-dehydroquinate synthase n=1 Tax=Alicyclobacillus sp. ALC3 TaxID=2796143 RepID=UPI00237834DD|nr:3-dehydroquinate synthase [Alicyclobacillus sp. ALC3]WDL97202.1 3-dehydroquinate synthase [Alicyclobacillus sp. ALC3]
MTTELSVRSATRTYPVVVGAGLLREVGQRLRNAGVAAGEHVLIVTDETVLRLGYPNTVLEGCLQAELHCSVTAVPPKDESKSLTMAEQLYNELLDAGVRRSGVVIAVGGGVVGDLAGFVAATYLRGVRFVQVPTTLLAHDSSIGGKVGVNLPRAKNLVGAFHPPIAVWYDVTTLASLPERDWCGGMAEVIKHGVIGNSVLFQQLAQDPYRVYPGNEQAEALVVAGISVKVAVVEADERESEQRMWLNLGHTVGHAVEQASHYSLNHGECVAIGMCVEAELAVQLGLTDESTRDQITSVVAAHHLPTTPPDYNFSEIAEILNLDKKHSKSGWTFVLPRAIGQVEIVRGVTEADLFAAWTTCRSWGGKQE